MTSIAPNMFPVLRYRDTAAAITFLVDAFGFRRLNVMQEPDGSVTHAELGLGPGVIMLAPERDDEFAGTAGKGSLYVALDDVDAHYERATAAGAQVVRKLEDTDYGSREYTVADREGNLWSFGTYRPAA